MHTVLDLYFEESKCDDVFDESEVFQTPGMTDESTAETFLSLSSHTISYFLNAYA
jgi:hypothetical protein